MVNVLGQRKCVVNNTILRQSNYDTLMLPYRTGITVRITLNLLVLFRTNSLAITLFINSLNTGGDSSQDWVEGQWRKTPRRGRAELFGPN